MKESKIIKCYPGQESIFKGDLGGFGLAHIRNPKGKNFSWSPSALSDFVTCPRQYAAKRFYETLPYVETAQMKAGTIEHKHLENRLKDKTPLPEGYERGEKYCQIFEKSGVVKTEQKLAINREMQPAGWFAKDAWGRCMIDVSVRKGNVLCLYDYKGLDIATKIPTPDGWTTVRDISVGDRVFAGDGSICNVIGKSEVFNRPCFKIEFRDSASVVCDNVHLWKARKCGGIRKYKILSTDEVFNIVSQGSGVFMPVAQPAEYPDRHLPIPPYVLGCWLGDGRRRGGEICKPNNAMFGEFKRLGYTIGGNIGGIDRCQTRTLYGLTTQLRELGLINNKRIPSLYLTAGIEQRKELVQGLMDTDGSWNFTRKQVVFTSVDKELSFSVAELLSSVGQKPYVVQLVKHGFGKDVIAYDVIFTPHKFVPFKHHPKTIDVETCDIPDIKNSRRYVKKICPIDSVPTQCIAVDSVDHTYLCTDRYIVTHNTGNIRENSLQLKINACFASVVMPDIETFVTRYIWLKHDAVTPSDGIFTIKEIPNLWGEILSIVERMEESWRTEKFDLNPSGLCRNYCGVTDCKFCGKGFRVV